MIALFLLFLLFLPAVSSAQVYTSHVTNGGDLWLAVTNHGVLGNNFVSRSASLEYPGGTGYEHLTHAGVWVGARTVDSGGAFSGVVTGGFDQFPGTSTATLTEFAPLSNSILVRSSNPRSPFYSPDALSDDETVVLFDDHEIKAASGEREVNRPLHVTVRQVTHAWAQAGYRDFVVVRYIVTSNSLQPLQDVWLGLYTELASGPKNNFATWPPPGTWFSKKLIEWDPTWQMLREHYCANQPVPSGCNFAVVPPWVGLQLLTPVSSGRQVTLAAWGFSPGDVTRDEDAERYALMSAGTIANLSDASLQPNTGDPTEMLAIGPMQLPAIGDSAEVAFAYVGGADVPSLQQHARSAQALADHGYNVALVDVPPVQAGARLAIRPAANPMSRTRIGFLVELPAAGDVRIELLDISGRRVASQRIGTLSAGPHEIEFTPSHPLSPGVYLVRLVQARGMVTTRVVSLGG